MKTIILIIAASIFVGCAHQLTNEEKAYLRTAMSYPTEYTVEKKYSDEIFARAQHYISHYSDMRLQIATDYILETYSPKPIDAMDFSEKYGYSISRRPVGDSVTFSVTCIPSIGGYRKQADRNSHACAYYMATGSPVMTSALMQF